MSKGNEGVDWFDSYTKHMFEVRPATGEDAEEIAGQRRKMYVEMGNADEVRMQGMVDAFVPWVRERLADGRYLGWIVWDGDVVVAGAGMFLMDFPPHWRDAQPVRAYLLNFYVYPAARRSGLAFSLLKMVIAETKSRGIKVAVLHASDAGRPLYKRNGFEPTNEMMLMMEPGRTG
jgi:ribosomal protein S18 acetylase RimI-like enzyme